MEQRTWPYGTKKNVTIIGFEFLRNPGNIILTCGEEESEEKFILMLRTPHDAERASVGDRGVISFKPGGPTGGYWDYMPRNPEDLFSV
jgi:hypothetical protein